VRRKHIVIRADDADICRLHQSDLVLIALLTGGKAVGKIATGELTSLGSVIPGTLHEREVVIPRTATAICDALC